MSLPALGIDIAKDTYQVTLLVDDQTYRGEFHNRPKEFPRLSRWLTKHGAPRVHACLEATGRYGDDLAAYLHEQAHHVSVVNPMRIKAFARSRLMRNKTDALDADLIANFCQSQTPSLWTPPAPELRELQELLHHYTTLQDARTQTLNRLAAGVKSPTVVAQLQAQLDLLDQQVADLKGQLDDHFDRHPDLKDQRDLFDSIPSIGPLTAAQLVAEDLGRFDTARAAAAFAGLTPMNGTSGSSVRYKSKLSKIGSPDLRRALYMPAVVALRCNPLIQALATRLAQRGKTKMTILAAVMHKLVVIAFGMVKSGKPFDANFAHQAQLAA